MILYIVSHILQIISLFLAFLSGAITFRLVYITRGGIASKSIRSLSVGILFLVLAFLTILLGVSADKLHAFEPSWFAFSCAVLLIIGFTKICYAMWILLKGLS